jgi:hypothetical protein
MPTQTQLDFGTGLVPVASSRATDPAASAEAAHQVEASGVAGAQRAICLERVRATPGLTAAEIAVEAELERHVPSRRLPELRRAGLVVNGDARDCRVTGNKSLTWNPS